ncbi:MAG: hydrogenase maturation protein [Xanthomonadaceae bacterium]|nr:hydrogenase maturation protein [Xanthomonadaceae bacterium]
MRILLISSSYNSLTQRVHVELQGTGNEVSVCLAVSDAEMVESTARFEPDLIVCPMLTKRVPDPIWKSITTLIVHPGIVGDRGPSSLDWAILDQQPTWGVTVLQADDEMDAGPIWATREFPARPTTKRSMYREEVSALAVEAVVEAVGKFRDGVAPVPLDYNNPAVRGRWRDPMKQIHRRIDWQADSAETVLRKIRASDGQPGVLDEVLGQPFFLFGAHPESELRGAAGQVIAQRNGAICRATHDGAVWISHLRRAGTGPHESFKLPATLALGPLAESIAHDPGPELPGRADATFKEIWYEESDGVGYLFFEFYNGAMSTEQCQRLRQAFIAARQRPTRAIVLAGGRLFWSNGIHLNVIEASDDPGRESMRNLEAMDDLVLEILNTDSHWVVSSVHGSAGAGGVVLALAADEVFIRDGVVLNPHYRSMGGLFGSEYWTYLLPRRVGNEVALALTGNCLPVLDRDALAIGLVDQLLVHSADDTFHSQVHRLMRAAVESADFDRRLVEKRRRRERDEARRPLAAYRADELKRSGESFLDPGSDYHVARSNFVRKLPACRTPARLIHPIAQLPRTHAA